MQTLVESQTLTKTLVKPFTMKFFTTKPSANARLVQDLQRDLRCAQDNISVLQTALYDAESLKEKLADSNAALAASQAQAADLRLRNQHLSEENQRLKDFISQMDTSSDSQRKDYEQENRRLSNLVSQMDERSDSQRENYEMVIHSLQSLYSQVKVDNKNLESRMDHLKTLISKSEKDAEDLKEQLLQATQDFKDQLHSKTHELEEERQKNCALKEAMKTVHIDLEKQLGKTKEELLVTSEKLNQQTVELTKERERNRVLQVSVLKHEQKTDHMIADGIRIRQEYRQLFKRSQEEKQVQKEEYEKNIAHQRQHIEELQQQLSCTTALEERSRKALHKAADKMKSNQEKFQESVQKIQDLEDTNKNLQKEMKSMKLAHDRAIEEAVNARKQSRQEDYIQELQDDLKQAANIIIERKKDIECLKITRDDYLQKNIKMSETIAEQQKTITELKEKLSREDVHYKFDVRQRGGAWPSGKQRDWNNYWRK